MQAALLRVGHVLPRPYLELLPKGFTLLQEPRRVGLALLHRKRHLHSNSATQVPRQLANKLDIQRTTCKQICANGVPEGPWQRSPTPQTP